VGAIIGRRGSNIANIQRQAQNLCSSTSSSNVRVSIVGHKHQQQHQESAFSNEEEFSTMSDDMTSSATSGELMSSANSNSSSVVPFTYTELDWSDPDWTPVVVKADVAAALFVGQQFDNLTTLQDTSRWTPTPFWETSI
jgi:hypothetical protein